RNMNTTQAQQKALADALVASAARLEFGKYVPAIYMQEFWATVTVYKSSIRFTINQKKVSLDVDTFREILQICPKILGQRFEEPPLEHDILSFLRDLGHSRDIHYITSVSIDYLHQPWRAFATIINKCLSGKDTAYEKIHLSRAQILWGMYNNKNIDYVYILWEDLLFQVENKDTKKTNKMLYPRFTKVIIDYFMSKDQSISKRNKMFWHTARDDTMFTSMRCVSRHEKSQKAPKEKYVRKKAESNTSPKKKTTPASKGSRLKSSAKVAKTDKKKQTAKMPKTKGLVVLSSGSGDRVDTQSKVPDEQQQKVFGINEGAGVRPEVPDVPKYDSESDKESWTFSANEETDVNDDSDETKSDNDGYDVTHPNLSTYKVDDEEEEEENKEGDDKDKEGEQEQDDKDDLYRDVNINLEKSDAEMSDAQANKDTKDAHVTLTVVPPLVQQ
ncbi:hypothetical protein Tco_1365985, partial [Tanacetum coccineum]